jgi:DNA-directed RNA polymerase subunit RPC12/RpoP
MAIGKEPKVPGTEPPDGGNGGGTTGNKFGCGDCERQFSVTLIAGTQAAIGTCPYCGGKEVEPVTGGQPL